MIRKKNQLFLKNIKYFSNYLNHHNNIFKLKKNSQENVFVNENFYLNSSFPFSSSSSPTKLSTPGPPPPPRWEDPAFDRLDKSFSNSYEAFKSKTNKELFRGLFIFQLCSFNYIVDHNKSIITSARKILGKKWFIKLMRATAYGHFVAGEDTKEIKEVVKRNMGFGVKSILDYSAEKDLTTEEAKEMDQKSMGDHKVGDRREKVTSARTYFYEDENNCDLNMEKFLDGIDAVSGATNATGFSAIKLTALGRPQFLLQLSYVLNKVNEYFGVLAQRYGSRTLKKKDFEKHLSSFELSKEDINWWFTMLDSTKDDEIDLLDWQNLLEVNVSLAKILRVPNIRTGKLEPLVEQLSDVEEEQMKNMLKRVDTILKHAEEKDVRVMIDAEQSYFQDAINRLCIEMMRKYNKKKALVFNTYQCYLKSTLDTLRNDLALSRREKFYFGAKLVRGAYIEQEKERAQEMDYEDPINPSFEITSKTYDNAVDIIMKEINQRTRGKVAVMVATHNEKTVQNTINKMEEYNIKSNDGLICFGQLYGMCDFISFPLGQAGYSVYKYVPYGPVEEVVPYITRRAVENRGILDKVKKEKKMIRKEWIRRMITFDWFYKPPKLNLIDFNAKKSSTSGNGGKVEMAGK